MAALRKTIILFIMLHLYIAFSALIFQHFEYQQNEEKSSNVGKMTLKLVKICNITAEKAGRIIHEILNAETNDQKKRMRESWKSFASSIWFVMTLFTTVGELCICCFCLTLLMSW